MTKQNTTRDAREHITGKLPKEELLAQLAEEATELAHAALKLRRVLDGTNPTPVDHITAKSALIEEIADVTLLLQLLELGMDDYGPDIKATMNYKLRRWAERLEAKE